MTCEYASYVGSSEIPRSFNRPRCRVRGTAVVTAAVGPRRALVTLQRRLTISTALVIAVAVLSLSALVLRIDAAARRQAVDDSLAAVANRAASLVYDDGGFVHTDAVADDRVAEQGV